jgi:long-chain acyl-CoA synthetase
MSEIARTFFEQARRTPDKCAIWCEREPMTYDQLAVFVRCWSNAMVLRGVERGDHIAVLLPNNIEFVALMLVAAQLGAVLVPMNPSLAVGDVNRAFQAADVKHLVATSAILNGLLLSKKLENSLVSGTWIIIDDDLLPNADNSHIYLLEDLLKSVSSEVVPETQASSNDPFILTMTSGSTGNPKPIILTQQIKLHRVAAAVELYQVTEADITLTATPLYHSLAERLVLIPLLTGGTAVLMRAFSPSAWLRCVSELSVSFTIAVSSQLRQIVQMLAQEPASLVSSLRCIVSSSALLDPSVKMDLLSKFSGDFHECYGASEIAIATNLDSVAAQKKLKSVGQAAPGVEIKILQENGDMAKTGESGEIICKTPMIFAGYYKNSDLTRQSMCEAYFRTGDVGRLDEDGFLYYLGRQKEIIITGGINVYPSDIECVLADHPAILECAAFPFPDKLLGEIVAVAIVPQDADNFNKRNVRFHCAEHLADFQQPRKIFIVDELPKNEMGKIMKQDLLKKFGTP